MEGILAAGIALIAIGLAFLNRAYTEGKSISEFASEALVAEGNVTELIPIEIEDSDDDTPAYQPVVVFTTQKGWETKFTGLGASKPPMYSIGDKVKVLYKEDTPGEARLANSLDLWGGVLIQCFLGIVCMFFGGMFWIG